MCLRFLIQHAHDFLLCLQNKACEKNHMSLLSSISCLSALAKMDIKFQKIKMQIFQDSYLAHDLFEKRQTLSSKNQKVK